MKVNWITLLIIGLIALLIIVGGYYFLTKPDILKTNLTTVDTSINVAVKVLDLVNDTPVTGAPVYFVICSPNGTSQRDLHMNSTTRDDGWAIFVANYTLDKDQVIYLGASNQRPLIEADFAANAFNGTGYLGAWKAFNYSVLYNNVDNKATVSCIITVDRDSGKMI